MVNLSQKFTLQRSVAILRVNEEILNNFLYYYIQTSIFQNRLKSVVNQSAQGGVYLNSLKKLNIKVTSDLTEQSRFDYEIIKLKDICKINKGKQLNKDAMIENGIYYVLNGGKEPSGHTNEWNAPKNTLTISEGGNSCGYVNFNTEKFWSGGHCYYLSNLDENVDNYYLYSYLKFKEEFIMRLRVGSGLPNIQKGDIENIKIKLVSKDNQNKISNLFLFVDKKINLIQIQKENFENFKKGLLQQMFILLRTFSIKLNLK